MKKTETAQRFIHLSELCSYPVMFSNEECVHAQKTRDFISANVAADEPLLADGGKVTAGGSHITFGLAAQHLKDNVTHITYSFG